jgi:hypothetical protein
LSPLPSTRRAGETSWDILMTSWNLVIWWKGDREGLLAGPRRAKC